MTATQVDKRNIKKGILITEMDSWGEFVERMKDPSQSAGTLIYRGQGNATWKVTSTLDRLEKKFPTTRNSVGRNPGYFNVPPVQRELQLRRFKEMARGRLTSQIPAMDEDEWWALAQHHGMATPMLDWTYSPFVALYFAFDEERCPYREPNRRVVFALAHHLIPTGEQSQRKEDRDHPKPFAPSWPGNYRLTNQAGLFLKMPQHVDLEGYVRRQFRRETYGARAGGGNLHPTAILTKCIIRSEGNDRLECLRYLDLMNINRASLFPDLDGAARYVNDLWEVNHDKAIGYINTWA